MGKRIIYLALILVHTVTLGQEQSVDSLETRKLEEITIKAVRAGEAIPISYKTIELKEIESQYFGQDPVIILENNSPSVVSYSDAGVPIGNYQQMRIRGIDQTRINFTLDGVPLNDMIDQGVFFSNFSDFGNSVQSIQVQRGVGTSTNGTASYGGSVNFESLNLYQENPEFNLQFTGGSFGTYRASGEVKTGILKNQTAFYGRYTRTISDGYKRHSGSNSQSFFFSGGYFGENSLLKVTGFSGKTQNDQAYIPVNDSIISVDPRRNNNSPNDTDDFEQDLITIGYSYWFPGNWNLNSKIYYGGSRGFFPFSVEGFGQIIYGLKNDHFGMLSDVSYENNQLAFNAGIHLYNFKRFNDEALAPDVSSPYYRDNTRKREASAFSKISYELGKFVFYGDLQFRYVSLNFESPAFEPLIGNNNATRDWFFVNPKVGLTYLLNENNSVYASFGRTGREPTRTDFLGAATTINEDNYLSIVDENSFEEEYVNDLEVGYELKGDMNLKVNYFYMNFENEIAPIGEFVEETFVQLRKNIPTSYRTGVEVSFDYSPDPKFNLTGQATYMQTNIDSFLDEESGQTFRDVSHILAPEWLATLKPSYRFTRFFTLRLNARYQSSSFMELTNQPQLKIPDFFVMDAQFDFRIFKWASASFFINNLWDETYFTFGSPEGSRPAYLIQAPRNYYIQLNMNF
jgi:iron complex outermembrane receptor protein